MCWVQVALPGLNGLAPGRAHTLFPLKLPDPTKNRNPQFLGREGSKAEVAGFSKFLTILDPVLPCLATIGWPLLINCGSKTTAAGAPAVNV